MAKASPDKWDVRRWDPENPQVTSVWLLGISRRNALRFRNKWGKRGWKVDVYLRDDGRKHR